MKTTRRRPRRLRRRLLPRRTELAELHVTSDDRRAAGMSHWEKDSWPAQAQNWAFCCRSRIRCGLPC